MFLGQQISILKLFLKDHVTLKTWGKVGKNKGSLIQTATKYVLLKA